MNSTNIKTSFTRYSVHFKFEQSARASNLSQLYSAASEARVLSQKVSMPVKTRQLRLPGDRSHRERDDPNSACKNMKNAWQSAQCRPPS
jgi:hypothetical protein